ncbi:MAG: hypothetical protein JWM99_2890 [Verrucomicrobiales bacterium]|nr:hypothetical protein [Verrucomicrobiales bacterium]
MMIKAFKCVLLGALFISLSHQSRGQGFPALTITNFGTYAVKSQTSIVDNDPGVDSSYSIVGGGNELWGPADKGIFGFFPVTGDFDVKVRVESFEPVHRYAKTGLMVRESVGSGSRMVSLFATPTGPTELPPDQPVGEDTVEWNFRRAAGDGSNNIGLGSPGYPNAWLRLARRGSIFYGMIGHDGTNWIVSGSVDTSKWPQGAFKAAGLLGLGSSSHDDTRIVKSELRQFSPVTSVGPIKIIRQPANVFGVADSTVTFSVDVNDPVGTRYQWYAGTTLLPSATNAVFTTPRLSATNDGTHYRVVVTGANGTETSSDAVLSVVSIDPPANPNVVYDFDDGEVPPGTAIYGSAIVDPSEGFGGSGGLVLTPAQNNQSGSFVVGDFNFGTVVDSFTVAFKLKIGPGSAKPADGFSFNFGTNIPSATFPAPQQGVGPGLAVSFDLYDNADGEAPAIDVFYGVDPSALPMNLTGNVLHRPVPLSDLFTSHYVDVIIRMNPDGKLDMVYDGDVIAYQLQTGFIPVSGGRFGFGAYAGGQNAFEGIDNILIETGTQSTDAYLGSVSPLGNNVSAEPQVSIDLVDLETLVDTNSIKLQFNGAAVTPVIIRDDTLRLTTVSYAVPTLLPAFSTNTVTIIWSDDANNRHTNTASFKVGNYVTLPVDQALPMGAGVASDSGVKARIYQIKTHLTENSTFAEAVLAGSKGANVADLTVADENGFFSDELTTTVVDWDVNAAPLGFSTFPGIPGLTDSKENFAADIQTYIQFPTAGFYQMGVRSDDGFQLTTGSASDPIIVGAFEGAREPFDTIFGFVVPAAGVYPFRLLYYQGSGGAALRWFSISDNGTQVLINDPNNDSSLKAFRSVTGVITRPVLAFARTASNLSLTWSGGGTLESAPQITGPWSPVTGASSPYVKDTTGAALFYRVHQ